MFFNSSFLLEIRREMYRVAIADSSSSSDDDDEQQTSRGAQRVQLRMQSSDPFLLTETEFRQMFRLSRQAVRSLLDEIIAGNPALLVTCRNRSSTIPFQMRFLATLNFFAAGSYQKPTAENDLFCQSQSSMSRSLHATLKEMMKLRAKYLQFPKTVDEIRTSKMRFEQKLNMPGVICAVDGTHINIIQPPESSDGHVYFNRKHTYSINVLAACDADMRFVYSDARFPGSVHDSAILQMGKLQELVIADGHTFVLGDSGFPLTNMILTPVLNAAEGSKELRYNARHKSARNVIERAFGVLKSRFRCLHKHRVLHYSPIIAARIVYACMILHNICILHHIEEDVLIDDVDVDENDNNDSGAVGGSGQQIDRAVARRVRAAYINRYF